MKYYMGWGWHEFCLSKLTLLCEWPPGGLDDQSGITKEACGHFNYNLRWPDCVLSCIGERPVTGLADFIITVSDAVEVAVSKNPWQTTGTKLLVKKYRETFRIPENINYYSKEDFQRAEKKYLKFCLTTGKCEDYRGLVDGDRE